MMGIEIQQGKRGFVTELLDWMESFAFAAVVALLLFQGLFRLVGVEGHSMEPTLYEGDRLLLHRFLYEPQVGDVIVVDDGKELLVKRIIATGGQEVDIDFDMGVVYRDGERLDEPYTAAPTYRSEGVEFPVTVPEDCLFVMGDNRNHSSDSRDPAIGMLEKMDVMGKVLVRFYPLEDMSVIF